MTWHLACLRLTGGILLGLCPSRYARLLPHPLPRILASGPKWKEAAVEFDATEVLISALELESDAAELDEAIQFLQDDRAKLVLLRHHERVSKAALKSAAVAFRELGL
jgi:hypothetical protein